MWTKQYLENQITTYPLNIAQLNKTANFNVNWRLTEDPKIDNGIMDLSFFMDIGPDQSYCSLPQQN